MKRVFLGGTCDNSTWRDELIPLLKIDYFNPVTMDWNEASRIEEARQKETCDYCLYVIAKATSLYSIAEAVDDSNKRPNKTIFCIISNDIIQPVLKHIIQVQEIVSRNGAHVFSNLQAVANFLNRD